MSCKRPYILKYTKNAKYLKSQNPDIEEPKGTATQVIYPSDENFISYEYYLDEMKHLKTDPIWQQAKKDGHEYGYKLIPCGKCEACRKNQKLQWALRLELESKEYQNNYFLTLTYNEDNLVIPEYSINKNTGEIYTNEENWRDWKGTLVPDHTIKFMNSYRKWLERDYKWDGLRFYLTGEYGEVGERPHYHLILMNHPQIELQPIGENPIIKKAYYTNERIEHIWGKGFINIGEVNWDSISYVAGYCQKKMFGNVKEEVYAIKGQAPIYANMSRNPGIARKYWEEHKDTIYEYDEIITSKGKSVKPPSYFDRLMDIGEADVMENIKEYRQHVAENELKKKMSKTNKTIQEQLLTELETIKHQNKEYEERRRKSKIKSM